MSNALRCPACGSTNCECDGRMHRCLDCGFGGTRRPTFGSCPVCGSDVVDGQCGRCDFESGQDQIGDKGDG